MARHSNNCDCEWCSMTIEEQNNWRSDDIQKQMEDSERRIMKAYFAPEEVEKRNQIREREIDEYIKKHPNVSRECAYIALYD